MGRSATIEITFVSADSSTSGEPVAAEGVIRLPDDTLRPFSGWIDLLAALEQVATTVHRRA